MPLRTGNDAMDNTFAGTNADGTPNAEYCKFCYAAGAFTEPALTVKDMIDKSAGHMTRVLKIDPVKAKEEATLRIPQLKRWQSPQP